MQLYKRNQVEEAIAAALAQPDHEAASDLSVRLKRLLETDRALARESAASSLRPLYAFYQAKRPAGVGRCGSLLTKLSRSHWACG